MNKQKTIQAATMLLSSVTQGLNTIPQEQRRLLNIAFDAFFTVLRPVLSKLPKEFLVELKNHKGVDKLSFSLTMFVPPYLESLSQEDFSKLITQISDPVVLLYEGIQSDDTSTD